MTEIKIIHKLDEANNNGEMLDDKDLLILLKHYRKLYEHLTPLSERFSLATMEAYRIYNNLRGYAQARGLKF